MAFHNMKFYTVEGFEQFIALPENRDRRLELIEGEIIEKTMPTDLHTNVAGWFIIYLGQYALEHDIGIPGPELRFQIPGDVQNSRIPDVAMIIDPETPLVTRGAFSGAPDIVVEVQSPDDSPEHMRERARFYVDSGVRLAILAFPSVKQLEVYRPNHTPITLTMNDVLSGYDVLPGFELSVAKIFVQKRSGK